MPGYVIANVNITDPEAYEKYSLGVPATVEKYGGRYIVRGGELSIKEGDRFRSRIAIAEFPSKEAAETWYHSPEYQAVLPYRLAASDGDVVIVEGL